MEGGDPGIRTPSLASIMSAMRSRERDATSLDADERHAVRAAVLDHLAAMRAPHRPS